MKGSVFPRPHELDANGKRRAVRGSTWTWSFVTTTTGKRRTKSKGGYRTQREAAAALSEALTNHARGAHVEPSKMTLKDYLELEWLPLLATSHKPSTAAGYTAIVRTRIVPHLGGVRLKDLTPGQLVAFYAELRRDGKLNGRGGGLSERSLRHTHAVLHRALEHAVEDGLIGRNPAHAIPRDSRPNPGRGGTVEMETWSAPELRRFLASIDGDALAPLFTLAATTGLRRGELLGLQWPDLDLERGTLAVRRSRTCSGYEVNVGAPKNGRARTLSLDPDTVAMLRRHRIAQATERLAWGEAWVDDGLGWVFVRPDGPIHPQAVSQAFERRVKAAGVPRIRFHDLRHTHATLMLEAGIHVKIVSERLGHSSVAITLDVYSHATESMGADAAAKVGALIFGTGA